MSLSRKGRAGAIRGSLASIATILTLFITVGCSSGSSGSNGGNSSSVTPPPPVPTTQVAYPATVEQNYLSNCEQGNGNAAFCQCTLNWFEAHITYTQFLANDSMARRSGQTPADLTNAEDACA